MSSSSGEKIQLASSIVKMTEAEAVASIHTKWEEYEKEYLKPICFVLAKKVSKRLPHKNKLLINGKPLVVYAIEAAKAADIFSAVVCSTDDMEIMEMAYDTSKCLLHKRPYELTTSRVQMKQVVKFLLTIYRCTNFCMMSPSNPFVTPEDLKAGYDMLMEKHANYVMSVKRTKPMENLIQLDKDGYIPPKSLKRSQNYKPTYIADGGFVFGNINAFSKEFDYGFYGSKCLPYITPHPSVDIDTQEDFDYAKYLMEDKCK